MSAASAESFLREQGDDFGWQGVAALKSHVDHLVRTDLNAAAELCERIDQLSQLAGGRVARAFAAAARAPSASQGKVRAGERALRVVG